MRKTVIRLSNILGRSKRSRVTKMIVVFTFDIGFLLVSIVLIDRIIAIGWKKMFVASKEQQIPPHDSTLLISNYLTHRVFKSQIFMDVCWQGGRWYLFAIWGCKRTENRGEDISDLSHTWFRPEYRESTPVLYM